MILENIRNRKTSTFRGAFALVVALAGLSGLLGIGCGGADLAVLTSHEIAEHGTLVLAAPRNVVFEACVQALKDEGYPIDAAEPVTGLVVTLPVRVQTDADAAPGEVRFRAYVVQVREIPGGKARVVVTPAPAEPGGAADMQRPTTASWDLERERASWARFFTDVRAVLATTQGQPR